jgi:hypothetical protein
MNSYSIDTKELIQQWGSWLGEESWDYFSTITYRFDVSARRNEKLMFELEKRLLKKTRSHKLFWIMENTSNYYQTHNHLLIKGKGARKEVDLFLKEKKLVIPKYVKHEPYDTSLGAHYYVSKHIYSSKVRYGISYSNDFIK